MITVVKKWGNSLGVRLPKLVASKAKVAEGETVSILAKQGHIVITPVRRRQYRLDDLLRGITPQNKHAAIESGPARGKEAW